MPKSYETGDGQVPDSGEAKDPAPRLLGGEEAKSPDKGVWIAFPISILSLESFLL